MSVVKQQQQQKDPYLMDFGLQNGSEDFDDDKMAEYPQREDDTNNHAEYNPYGWATVTPSRPTTIMTTSYRHSDNHPHHAAISDRDVVDWPAASDDDDRSDNNHHINSNENDDHAADLMESKQEDDDDFHVLYHNAHYQQHNSNTTNTRSTRRVVVTPNQRPPRPAAVDTTITATAAPSAPNTTRERLDEVECHIKVLESNVTLHKRLGQLEDQLHERDSQLQLLQQQFEQLMKHAQHQDQQLRQLEEMQVTAQPAAVATVAGEEWDAAVVTWKIPKFEKKLTTERHFFESSPFGVSWYTQFYLTVCVLEVKDTVPESKRPVAIFLKAKPATGQRSSGSGQSHQVSTPPQSSIFPIRLDGSKITLVSSNHNHGVPNKTVQVGQTQMEDASQGKGVRQFTTLGTLREFYLQDDASVVVRATVRVPRIPIYRLRTV